MGLSSHQSAKVGTTTWLTPPDILAKLGTFDLDPCAAPSPRPWATAKRHIELPECGLSTTWHGRVWCNPPFGSEAEPFIRRMADHGNGIALLPARTETALWFDHVWGRASGVLFLRSRPHFHSPDGQRAKFNSGAPIALIAYSETDALVLRDCGLGAFVIPMGALP